MESTSSPSPSPNPSLSPSPNPSQVLTRLLVLLLREERELHQPLVLEALAHELGDHLRLGVGSGFHAGTRSAPAVRAAAVRAAAVRAAAVRAAAVQRLRLVVLEHLGTGAHLPSALGPDDVVLGRVLTLVHLEPQLHVAHRVVGLRRHGRIQR